jgi:magnesium-transporting ATPase (P-type)
VDIQTGINEDTIEERSELYGGNIFPVRPPKSLCELIIEALDDLTMQILIVCAIISIVINFSTGEDP